MEQTSIHGFASPASAHHDPPTPAAGILSRCPWYDGYVSVPSSNSVEAVMSVSLTFGRRYPSHPEMMY